MKNTFGNSICVTLFGESHGEAIGAVVDGLAPGITVDEEYISSRLLLRRPASDISTARREKDEFKIVSGVLDGKTTGAPLCVLIPNEDVKSADYDKLGFLARPGHADMTAYEKYHGFEDRRGGGHFSGRLTAPLVAVGAIAENALKEKGIFIGTHIKRCANIADRRFENVLDDVKSLEYAPFPVLDKESGEKMKQAIVAAKESGDSVGGVLETVVCGVPAGVGEPWFDGVESALARALFGIPAVKGVEFGAGFAVSDMKGSEANDAFYSENGKIYTKTNNNGGVLGGITNGMPIVFSCAIKPTPSIALPQQTVDVVSKENSTISVSGRHDPAIVHRARAVVDAATALVIADLLAVRYGTDFFGEKR
ncbi:MAG: chorismate synthase [Clostridia bacterium]|nr:chorismate synthase [Clostridia bacterium]